jgi:hypothetical protein
VPSNEQPRERPLFLGIFWAILCYICMLVKCFFILWWIAGIAMRQPILFVRKHDNMISIFFFIDIITTQGPKPPSRKSRYTYTNHRVNPRNPTCGPFSGLEGSKSKFMLNISEGNHWGRCLLCIEAPKLLRVPWVAFFFAYLFVLKSICSSRYYFCNFVRSQPWWF